MGIVAEVGIVAACTVSILASIHCRYNIDTILVQYSEMIYSATQYSFYVSMSNKQYRYTTDTICMYRILLSTPSDLAIPVDYTTVCIIYIVPLYNSI